VELPYDQLIVALGWVSRNLPISGLAEPAVGFKSLLEALHLRDAFAISSPRTGHSAIWPSTATAPRDPETE
jgi:NADH dehydrogenase FAD-containing subunit